MSRTLLAAIALTVVTAAQAQSRTYVSFAGRNDELPKLGLPGISVKVFGPRVAESELVRAEIARVLGETVHTRPLAEGDVADYALAVTLATALENLGAGTIPFEAILTSADGKRLWRVEGRTEVDRSDVEPQPLVSIARNVVAALVHDGWVTNRYDPEDPPPAPPTIRRSGTHD